ncbi:MAG: multicopper oxidase family protein [Leptolyngbya sp.]|nr:multicopper oxidase family protein [Leptolyngbya sp.]
MERRRFLSLMAAVAGMPLVARCARLATTSTTPTVYRSEAGLLDIDLTAHLGRVSLGGRSATLMTYNQQIPGPQLEVQPGDRVRIRLTNALDQPTNLHYHGLHLPPTGLADDPFRTVAPGETVLYDFPIPDDHPSGFFWYHPHQHGLVAQQVFHGLAGTILVRGKDEPPELAAAQEAVLVLQDFDLDRQGQVQEPTPPFRMWGRQGNFITVNGQVQPRFTLSQGKLLRLRILNASASRVYRIQLADHPWWLAATDGLALADPVAQDAVVLAPGERADLLVPGDQPPGRYALLSLPYDRGIAAMAKSMGHRIDGVLAEEVQTIATLDYAETTVSGSESPPSITRPTTLGTVETLPQPAIVREFIFDHGIDPETHDPFLINGRAFGHHRVDTQVQVGTVEDWVLINKAGMDHPFHLHSNWFQVISRNGQPEPLRAWRDTVNLRAYETVRIRIPFRDFVGKTVYHCHILDHEDQGMMGIVEMV